MKNMPFCPNLSDCFQGTSFFRPNNLRKWKRSHPWEYAVTAKVQCLNPFCSCFDYTVKFIVKPFTNLSLLFIGLLKYEILFIFIQSFYLLPVQEIHNFLQRIQKCHLSRFLEYVEPWKERGQESLLSMQTLRNLSVSSVDH